MAWRSLLNQPFPYSGQWQSRLRLSLFFGGFVLLFLFLFRPFDLDLVPTTRALFIAGVFGAVCTGTVLIGTILIPLLFPSFFAEEKWTTGRQMFFVLLIVFLVGLANYICSAILNGGAWSIEQAVWYQGITLAIGTPPLFVRTLLRQAQLLRKYQEQAANLEQKLQEKLQWQQKWQADQSLNEGARQSGTAKDRLSAMEENAVPDLQTAAEALNVTQVLVTNEHEMRAEELVRTIMITISGDYQNESITVAADRIFVVHAANNYVKVYYEENGKVIYSIIRLTLKRAEELLAGHDIFFRCHRATIINLDKVLHVEGNAQGYKVKIAGIDESIPVSRSLGPEFTDRLLAIRKHSN